uniref:Putative secreted peptide n=1 Tax=Anopheles braziliensis TaxID=58242 RepID=A0A2M3ZRV8_9DIPT
MYICILQEGIGASAPLLMIFAPTVVVSFRCTTIFPVQQRQHCMSTHDSSAFLGNGCSYCVVRYVAHTTTVARGDGVRMRWHYAHADGTSSPP